jgi:hypothetical protein
LGDLSAIEGILSDYCKYGAIEGGGVGVGGGGDGGGGILTFAAKFCE